MYVWVQQEKMVRYFVEIFGPKLLSSFLPDHDADELPSPAALRGKILIKHKKLGVSSEERSVRLCARGLLRIAFGLLPVWVMVCVCVCVCMC